MSSSGQQYYQISAAFELNLHAPVLEGLVTAGRFLQPQSTEPSAVAAHAVARAPLPAVSLACASSGQQVILHNNNNNTAAARRSARRGSYAGGSHGAAPGAEEATVQSLNFGKQPTALAAGALSAGAATPQLRAQDALLLGAATSILAYDVDQGRQVFYNDVMDGVRAVVCGPLATAAPREGPAPSLVVVGGNCSVYGFDRAGVERYWTVTGDEVTAMALLPWTAAEAAQPDAPRTLLAASEDYEIRAMAGEEAIASIMEVDRVRCLVPASRLSSAPERAGRFAYLLDNGTVGVYQGGERVWRFKGRSTPVSAAFCDVDGDGVEELVVGWRSGRVEVRSDLPSSSTGGTAGGTVLYRETGPAPVAAVLAEDYHQDGRPLPIVCFTDGCVRGLTLLESRQSAAEVIRAAHAVDALIQQQQLLASQLASLEAQLAMQATGDQDITMPSAGATVRAACHPSADDHKLHIVFSIEHGTGDEVIQSGVLKASSSIFGHEEEDLLGFYADQPAARYVCSVAYPSDMAAHVSASIVVGSAFAEHYQIMDAQLDIPAFIMYEVAGTPPAAEADEADGGGCATLRFNAPLRLDAIEAWLRANFVLPSSLTLVIPGPPAAVSLRLTSARDGSALTFDAISSEDGTGSLAVRAGSLEACADILAIMEEDLGCHDILVQGNAPVEVTADFPREFSTLLDKLQCVEAFNAARAKLTADTAEAATNVKALLVRAEDARLLGDIVCMKKTYTTLHEVDRELLGENAKRVVNYDELKAALKEVNSYIMWGGRLRWGPAKAALVAACRSALKESASMRLVELIRTGSY